MIEYIKSIPRKAWWLIGWSALYAMIALGYMIYEIQTDVFFTDKSQFRGVLMLVQMPWLIIMGAPLWPGTRLNHWVFHQYKKPFYMIQEIYSHLYVSYASGTDLSLTTDRLLAKRWTDLKEARAVHQTLETTHSSPHDRFELQTVFRVTARKPK